jgi:hypothetical protein
VSSKEFNQWQRSQARLSVVVENLLWTAAAAGAASGTAAGAALGTAAAACGGLSPPTRPQTTATDTVTVPDTDTVPDTRVPATRPSPGRPARALPPSRFFPGPPIRKNLKDGTRRPERLLVLPKDHGAARGIGGSRGRRPGASNDVSQSTPCVVRCNQNMVLSPEAQRLRTAFELFEAGVRLMTERLRRQHPGTSSEALEELVRDWLLTRPGAETGDADGVPVSWPR